MASVNDQAVFASAGAINVSPGNLFGLIATFSAAGSWLPANTAYPVGEKVTATFYRGATLIGTGTSGTVVGAAFFPFPRWRVSIASASDANGNYDVVTTYPAIVDGSGNLIGVGN